MSYISKLTLLIALMGYVFIGQAHNASAAKGLTVVELFTSPGCSDTPPASEQFEKLSDLPRSNLILISCHVTFFEEQVPDPFAREFCDFRHDQYSNALGLSESSTPKTIINGQFDTKGDQEHILQAAINLASSMNDVSAIQLDLGSKDLSITLPKINVKEPADIWLFAYKKREDMPVTAGPLAGKIMKNINVATHAQKLLNWDGGYRNLNVPKDMFPADGFVIIAQAPKTMKIVAAGSIEKD